MTAKPYSLAELMITTAARAWADDGEVLATGIGVLPRLAASLAMKTLNRDLMMTDSESFLLSEPNPIGARPQDFQQKNETWMGFSRIFLNVWSGKRHAMVMPTQIDRFGQANISCIGDYNQPKVQMLGARGFPGNSISHANSFLVTKHSKRVFVDGTCDMVSSIGYNPERLPKGYALDDIDIRQIISDLCVMDFLGKGHKPRIRSIHPGVDVDHVIANTGFDLEIPNEIPVTKAPSAEELETIAQLDPYNFRAKQIKENPPGDRR